MSVQVVKMEFDDAEMALDHAVMEDLRTAVGQTAFDEIIGDAIFEVTERIARIEQLAEERNLAVMARVAHDLVAVAGQIGLSGVSVIAANLERCCASDEPVAAYAIARRLVRMGEASLIAAAKLSFDLAQPKDGAQAG